MQNLKHPIVLLLMLFISSSLLGQNRNKEIGDYFRIGGLFSNSNSSSEYIYNTIHESYYNDLDLDFLTPNSGLFELEQDTLSVTHTIKLTPPKRLINFGMSFQKINQSGIFQEYSLTNLAFTEFEVFNEIHYFFQIQNKTLKKIQSVTSKSFQIGLRFEYGKFFRDMKSSKFNYGLSLFIKPDYNQFSLDYGERNQIPLRSSEFSSKVGIGSTFLFKVSKRIFTEIKVYPSYQLFNTKWVFALNPAIPFRNQRLSKSDNSSILHTDYILSFKYSISVPYRRGKKMKF